MAIFSFVTSDTQESITVSHSPRGATPVKMVWVQHGQLRCAIENDYRGYGMFGGIDFFSLIDELNGGKGERERGHFLWQRYKNSASPAQSLVRDNVIFPRLISRSWNGKVDHLLSLPINELCDKRGYFFDELEVVDFSF